MLQPIRSATSDPASPFFAIETTVNDQASKFDQSEIFSAKSIFSPPTFDQFKDPTKRSKLEKSLSFPNIRLCEYDPSSVALSAEEYGVPESMQISGGWIRVSSKNDEPYVLVTGGCGFIGSHTVVELLNADYNVVIVDNLDNSSAAVIDRISEISGKRPDFIKLDLLHKGGLERVFRQYNIQSVVHFAALKSVGESVSKPIKYYVNNIQSTLNLVEVMQAFGVYNLVFSSSATVYGHPEKLPLIEICRLQATNPYGRTKLHLEEILKDLYLSDKRWNIIILRYFNPVGAHPSGRMGEDPRGIPNNLMPFVAQVANGKREFVNVFGNDYETKDGTGVRDYIHVVDLAEGHVASLNKVKNSPGYKVYNLGTGSGYSVLDMIGAMSVASGKDIPVKFTARRPGDVGCVYCDPTLANEELNWKATRDLTTMCRDLWKWQSQNPAGYDG